MERHQPAAPKPDRAVAQGPAVRFEPMAEADLDAVLAVEQGSYSHAWTRGNFRDALEAGHDMPCLWAGDRLVGYFVAMAGHREVHLLNLTVAPDFRGQGWARVLLDALALWARARRAEAVWLEVRAGNTRALELYRHQGFAPVGRRRNYYPVGRTGHEDAILMTLSLAAGEPDAATVRRSGTRPRSHTRGAVP